VGKYEGKNRLVDLGVDEKINFKKIENVTFFLSIQERHI
jgi:hypothetical protein